MRVNISDVDCVEAYAKHKNLKLAADAIGMKWQTLYVRLRNNGVAVIGDKAKYGSLSDRAGAKGEKYFSSLVPRAIDQNKSKFQAPVDFDVDGILVDVKASLKRSSSKRTSAMRWSFSISRQVTKCDFFVFVAYNEAFSDAEKVFLIPAELVRNLQTITISATGASKWDDYRVEPEELAEFFSDLAGVN